MYKVHNSVMDLNKAVKVFQLDDLTYNYKGIYGILTVKQIQDMLIILVTSKNQTVFSYLVNSSNFIEIKEDLAIFSDVFFQFQNQSDVQEFQNYILPFLTQVDDTQDISILKTTQLLQKSSLQHKIMIKTDNIFDTIQGIFNQTENETQMYQNLCQLFEVCQQQNLQQNLLYLILQQLFNLIQNSKSQFILLRAFKIIHLLTVKQNYVVNLFISQDERFSQMLEFYQKIIYKDTISCEICFNKQMVQLYLQIIYQLSNIIDSIQINQHKLEKFLQQLIEDIKYLWKQDIKNLVIMILLIVFNLTQNIIATFLTQTSTSLFFKVLINEIQLEFQLIAQNVSVHSIDDYILKTKSFNTLQKLIKLLYQNIYYNSESSCEQLIIDKFLNEGQLVSQLFQIINNFVFSPLYLSLLKNYFLSDIFQVIVSIDSIIKHQQFYKPTQDMQETLVIFIFQFIKIYITNYDNFSSIIKQEQLLSLLDLNQIVFKNQSSLYLSDSIVNTLIVLCECEFSIKIYYEVLNFTCKICYKIIQNNQQLDILYNRQFIDIITDLIIDGNDNKWLIQISSILLQDVNYYSKKLRLLLVFIKLEYEQYQQYMLNFQDQLLVKSNTFSIQFYFSQIVQYILLDRKDLLQHLNFIIFQSDITNITAFLNLKQWFQLFIQINCEDHKLSTVLIQIISVQFYQKDKIDLASFIEDDQNVYLINKFIYVLHQNDFIINTTVSVLIQDLSELFLQDNDHQKIQLDLFTLFQVLKTFNLSEKLINLISHIALNNEHIITNQEQLLCDKLFDFMQIDQSSQTKNQVLKLILLIQKYSNNNETLFDWTQFLQILLENIAENSDFISQFIDIVPKNSYQQLFEELFSKLNIFDNNLATKIATKFIHSAKHLTTHQLLEIVIFDPNTLFTILSTPLHQELLLQITATLFNSLEPSTTFYIEKIQQSIFIAQKQLFSLLFHQITQNGYNLIQRYEKIIKICLQLLIFNENLIFQILDSNILNLLLSFIVLINSDFSLSGLSEISSALTSGQKQIFRSFQQELNQETENQFEFELLILNFINQIFENTEFNSFSEQICTPIFYNFLNKALFHSFSTEKTNYIIIIQQIIINSIKISKITSRNFFSQFSFLVEKLHILTISITKSQQSNLYASNTSQVSTPQQIENTSKILQIISAAASQNSEICDFKLILTLGCLITAKDTTLKFDAVNTLKTITDSQNTFDLIVNQVDCGVVGVPIFEVLKEFLMQENDEKCVQVAGQILSGIYLFENVQVQEICKRYWAGVYSVIKAFKNEEIQRVIMIMK